MKTRWTLRPCFICGYPVLCEPDYPPQVRVTCWRCLRASIGQ